jgi:hypothetical protein
MAKKTMIDLDREAVLLDRDTKYAEHMYRNTRGSLGGAEHAHNPNDPWLQHKPGLIERAIMFVLGVK